MSIALLPGSFDPPTTGHIDILKRCISHFDKLIVVVAINSNKTSLLDTQDRITLLRSITSSFKNVEVDSHAGLIVEYAKLRGAKFLVRGVRSESDFRYELELSHFNKRLNSDVETFLLAANPSYSTIRSSHIKELWSMGGDLGGLVPSEVFELLKNKYSK